MSNRKATLSQKRRAKVEKNPINIVLLREELNNTPINPMWELRGFVRSDEEDIVAVYGCNIKEGWSAPGKTV
jgi:hypothetical protein